MPRPPTTWDLETTLSGAHGCACIAGVDEAGRGAWAGPVVVAAVILPPDGLARDYRDSKQLTPRARERLAAAVKLEALDWTAEIAPASEVDAYGVLLATQRAAVRAIERLDPPPDGLITDYLKLPLNLPFLAPPRADETSVTVAAASLIAKTTRDALMRDLDETYPGFGFAAHKGYGVPQHARALVELGVTPEHRRTFAPVRAVLPPNLGL